MKSNQKVPSRIIQEMQASISGLDRALKVNKKNMRQFTEFSNLNVTSMTPSQIKELREKSSISQAVLAAVLNTSLSTVQKWEIGDKQPSGPSLKLLSLIERKGLQTVI
jgi:putative transcriptional regulator